MKVGTPRGTALVSPDKTGEKPTNPRRSLENTTDRPNIGAHVPTADEFGDAQGPDEPGARERTFIAATPPPVTLRHSTSTPDIVSIRAASDPDETPSNEGELPDSGSVDSAEQAMYDAIVAAMASGLFGPGMGHLAMAAAPAGRPRANFALATLQAPASDHPAMIHAADVRQKIPESSMEGGRALVVGEHATGMATIGGGDLHASAMVRMIAGPVGLAPNAHVELLEPALGDFELPSTPEAIEEAHRVAQLRGRVFRGEASLGELCSDSVDSLVFMIDRTIDEFHALSQRGKPGGPICPVNMSWGSSLFSVAGDAIDTNLAHEDSQLLHDLNVLRSERGLPALDPAKNPADGVSVRRMALAELIRELDERQPEISVKRDNLARAVAEIRERGFLPICAAGNEFFGPPHTDDRELNQLRERVCRSIIAGTPGIIVVGATNLSGELASFSNHGATLCAPGVDTPTYPDPEMPYAPADASGTSFAAPYIASVVVLMGRANPRLSCREAEVILLRSTDPIEDPAGQVDPRGGFGCIDPVKAVDLARQRGQRRYDDDGLV